MAGEEGNLGELIIWISSLGSSRSDSDAVLISFGGRFWAAMISIEGDRFLLFARVISPRLIRFFGLRLLRDRRLFEVDIDNKLYATVISFLVNSCEDAIARESKNLLLIILVRLGLFAPLKRVFVGMTIFKQWLRWALSSNSFYLIEGKIHDTYPIRRTDNLEYR